MCGPFLITHGRFPCDLCERRAHHENLATDHIIAATGYRFAARSLPLLNHCCAISAAPSRDPLLSPSFESSIPRLYFSLLAFPAPHGGNPE